MNSNVKQYLKEIPAKLNCPKGVKSVFLRQLKGEVSAFAESNPTVTVEGLYNEFGTPEEIATGFFDREDYNILLKKAKNQTIIWMCVSTVTLILLILVLLMVIGLIDVFGLGSSVTISDVTYIN